jgi:exodeoxyribonuclease V alpha subunit
MMQGIAKKLFVDKEGENPFNCTVTRKRKGSWPLLERMAEQRCIAFVDLFLAESLLRPYLEVDESAAALLCYLSMVSRNGHMCIRLDDTGMHPDPAESFSERWNRCDEDLLPIQPEELAMFSQLLSAGLSKLPPELICEDPRIGTLPSRPLCKTGKNEMYLYFQKSWMHETRCLEAYRHLLLTPPSPSLDPQMVDRILECENKLLPEQKLAIRQACTRGFTMISGGPGTGKTYTAGFLIKVLWSLLSSSQKENFQIALAAPTGKAAANLQKSLSKAVAELQDFPEIKAKTLHNLLDINKLGKHKKGTSSFLSADLVLVDECSMIDANVMGMLLSAVKPQARIVLLGDAHQLPAVEAGSLFGDFMALTQQSGGGELTKCVRAELRAIVDFAKAIKAGNYAEAKEQIAANKEGVSVLSLAVEEDLEAVQEKLFSYAGPLFRIPIPQREEDFFSLLEAFNKFRILSPLRKGDLGVEALNQFFVKKFQKMSKGRGLLVSPIMIIRNDYRLNLFNGETGVLIHHFPGASGSDFFQQGDYAIFPGTSEREFRKVPAFLLPNFEYAYVLSVHKSQGSEFERVLLMMPKGSEVFGREVLYTAVTRAKKSLEIWGEEETLKKTIEKRSVRVSGLAFRFTP